MRRIVQPEEKYFESFINSINESEKIKENNELNYTTRNYDSLFHEVLENWNKEEYYWLVDENDFLGDLILRKKLSLEILVVGGHISYSVSPDKRNRGYGKELLEYALRRSKELELNEVILTCYEDNTYSKKLIEAAGGVQVSRFLIKSLKKVLLRYSIILSK